MKWFQEVSIYLSQGLELMMFKHLLRTSLVPTDHAARSAYAAQSAAPRLRAARSAAQTSHTRLAQMVADTIFDRREL